MGESWGAITKGLSRGDPTVYKALSWSSMSLLSDSVLVSKEMFTFFTWRPGPVSNLTSERVGGNLTGPRIYSVTMEVGTVSFLDDSGVSFDDSAVV